MARWDIDADYSAVVSRLNGDRETWLESICEDVSPGDVPDSVMAIMVTAWGRASDYGLTCAFWYLRNNGLGDTLPGVVMPDQGFYDMIDPCEREDYAVAEDAAHEALIAAAVHVAALACTGAAVAAGRAILERN